MRELLLACTLAGLAAATYDLGGGYFLTTDQHLSLATDIESTIYSVRELDEDGVLYYPLVAGFTRLAFHQCLSGKCTGCINLNDRNNLHLSRYVNALEDVRRRNPFVRYGDLWALGGIVALKVSESLANIRFGRSLSHTKLLQFRYGREDCPTAPHTNALHAFPSFSKGLDHVLSYFSGTFGLTEHDTVALMGIHKLGGFRNPLTGRITKQWTSPADTLDNSYYIAMADGRQNWRQSAQSLSTYSTPVYFWTNGTNKRLFFNSDMCFLKDITFVSNGEGQASCDYASCRLSRTAYLVYLYAFSNEYWLSAFMPAYMKMTERGYGAGVLKSPVVFVPPPTSRPKYCFLIFCF